MSIKKKKTPKNRKSKINVDPSRILRTVSENEAFYFYEDIGKPTGENARNLIDFLEKIKSAKLETILFHHQRKDFKNWIEKTLGDSELAKKIERITPSYDDKLRTQIQAIIEGRLKELKGTTVTLWVNDNLTVASSSRTS
ncbi:MAG: DUF5752 family protein [Candidatus Bathyarchaeota archaeon]|jgi:hypothetical protein|nr:hypothetical protein [Candidatus Bathyarchaeota archaeon A05DMB-5]MDH7558246.1 DUF5752 family protein [Candidatus Bathyarchaeota archaeon]